MSVFTLIRLHAEDACPTNYEVSISSSSSYQFKHSRNGNYNDTTVLYKWRLYIMYIW